jgi:hypothetical protein
MSAVDVLLVERLLAALAVLPFGLGFTAGSDLPAADDVVFSFADPAIIESSGLIARDGLFATINDSGDSGRVFTVDPANGETVAETRWDGQPEDVEAMALTPDGDVLVGDIGDNTASRDSIELLQVPFGEDGTVDPATYELVYPDGAHDAETLLVHPVTGQVFVVAKEFIGRLYVAPKRLDPDGGNRLRPIGEVLPIATDGAFFPDGKHFVLRGYVKAAVYEWPSLDMVGEPFFLPSQEQGEGIAVGADDTVYLSSEGEHSEVLHIELPANVQAALDGSAPDRSGEGGGQNDDDGQRIEGPDPSDATDEERPWWPWALGGGVGVLILLVLLRSLRPR